MHMRRVWEARKSSCQEICISFKSKTSFQAKKKINPAIKLMQNAFVHKGISSLQKQVGKI